MIEPMTKLLHDVIPTGCQVTGGYVHVWVGKQMITQFYVITQPVA